MTVKELKEKLDEKGVKYDPNAKKNELELLLKNFQPSEPKKEEPSEEDDFTIADPEELRPVELPLVVKPPKEGWENDAQEKYASILNAYAYRNPKKWRKKKSALVKKLRTLGDEPEELIKYRGHEGQVKYKDHKIGNKLET